MYYEERWVNGRLCHRSSPRGKFVEFSNVQYAERIRNQQMEIDSLRRDLRNYEKIKKLCKTN